MPMTSTTATVATKATTPALAPAKAAATISSPVPAPALKTYALRTPANSTVSAIQYLGHPDAAGQFAGHATREDPLHQQTLVLVQTVDGGRPAFPGDWIIQDSKGQASVMKDQEFVGKYNVDAPITPVKPPAPAPVAAKPAAPVVPAKPAAPAPVAAAKPATPPAPVKPAATVKQPMHDILT